MRLAFLFLLLTLHAAPSALAAPKEERVSPAARPKWEYKHLGWLQVYSVAKQQGKEESIENGLNALGEEGWELVTVVLASKAGTSVGGTGDFFFKRRKE